jgi:hypothetical protein
MTAPSVPAEGDGDPFLPVPLSEAPEGVVALSGGGVPRLLLSDVDRTREALLAARVAVEHIRVAAPSDSRATANYAARVVDNSRALAAGDGRLHLNLLAGHVTWLRSLPAGVGELRW